MKRILIALLLTVAAVGLQGPLPIPECQGPECTDDATHQDHHGAPAWCQNFSTPAWSKNCACERDCDEMVGSGCVTYCRSKLCHCDHGCDSK